MAESATGGKRPKKATDPRKEKRSHQLAARLKELRAMHPGLSLQKAADGLGVPKGTYVNWEFDRAEPPLAMIPVIADFYGVTTDMLLGVDGQLICQDIVRKLAELGPEDRATIDRIVTALCRDREKSLQE